MENINFGQAIRKQIKNYFEGIEPTEYKKALGVRKLKYGKPYFDKLAEEHLSEKKVKRPVKGVKEEDKYDDSNV